MKSQGLSIRSLQILALLLAGLLPLGLFLFLGEQYLAPRLEEEAYDKIDAYLNVGVRQITDRTTRYNQEVIDIASHRDLFKLDPRQNEEFNFKKLRKIYKTFVSKKSLLTLLTTDGTPVSADEEIVGPARIGSSKAFYETLQTVKATSSKAHLLPTLETPMVAIYHPVHDEAGKLSRVLRNYIPVNDLFPDNLDEGYFVWIDTHGEVLVGSNLTYQTNFQSLFPGWTADKAQGVCTDKAKDEKVFYTHAQLNDIPMLTGGKLIYLYPARLAMANLVQLRRLGLLATGASMFLILLFSLGAGAWIARPIRAAAAAAADVADGDLYTVLPADQGPSELRQLSLTLNGMTSEVRRRRDNLEDLVTQRTRSLQEMSAFLHAIMDSFQDALIVIDADSNSLRFINREAYRLFEFPPKAAAVLPPNADDVCQKLSAWMGSDANWQAFHDLAKKADSPRVGRFATADDTIESVEIGTAPVHDPQGEILGTLWVFRDISERERDEAKERQRQKLEAVGRLAGGIAHDFNNILTAIQGGIELAIFDQEDGNNPIPALINSRTGCKRAASVVHQLLSFSRKRPLELKPTDLTEVVEETIGLVSPGIDPRIRIQPLHESNDAPMVEADPVQLQQVLMNLLINASHAMEAGIITVRCAIEPDPNETFPDGACIIQVTDTGHGMSPETMAHIFDPYFTTKEPGKGTGLGLATSIGIIERHQGTINCQSTEGLGTTFTVRLPRRESNASAVPKQVPIPIESALSARILIIDDEAPVRGIGRRLLERAYHTVEEAETGLEGLEKIAARSGDYDLIILDLTMPRLSGAETLQRIRASWPTLPVLVWSGHSKDAIRMLSGSEAPDGYINKPFNAETLQRKVTEILRANHAAKNKSQPFATKA